MGIFKETKKFSKLEILQRKVRIQAEENERQRSAAKVMDMRLNTILENLKKAIG